jgi:hypothetical protein
MNKYHKVIYCIDRSKLLDKKKVYQETKEAQKEKRNANRVLLYYQEGITVLHIIICGYLGIAPMRGG